MLRRSDDGSSNIEVLLTFPWLVSAKERSPLRISTPEDNGELGVVNLSMLPINVGLYHGEPRVS
jgi:hypothetical protein